MKIFKYRNVKDYTSPLSVGMLIEYIDFEPSPKNGASSDRLIDYRSIIPYYNTVAPQNINKTKQFFPKMDLSEIEILFRQKIIQSSLKDINNRQEQKMLNFKNVMKDFMVEKKKLEDLNIFGPSQGRIVEAKKLPTITKKEVVASIKNFGGSPKFDKNEICEPQEIYQKFDENFKNDKEFKNVKDKNLYEQPLIDPSLILGKIKNIADFGKNTVSQRKDLFRKIKEEQERIRSLLEKKATIKACKCKSAVEWMEAGSQIMDVFITDLSKELEFYTPKISVSEVEK